MEKTLMEEIYEFVMLDIIARVLLSVGINIGRPHDVNVEVLRGLDQEVRDLDHVLGQGEKVQEKDQEVDQDVLVVKVEVVQIIKGLVQEGLDREVNQEVIVVNDQGQAIPRADHNCNVEMRADLPLRCFSLVRREKRMQIYRSLSRDSGDFWEGEKDINYPVKLSSSCVADTRSDQVDKKKLMFDGIFLFVNCV